MDVARSFWWLITATQRGEQVPPIHIQALLFIKTQPPDDYLLTFFNVKCVFDLLRCSKSLQLLVGNAAMQENRKIEFYDQIYPARNEQSCVDVFCELVRKDNCHCAQFVLPQIDAVYATFGH